MTFAYDEQLLSAVEQAMSDNDPDFSADIACERALNALDDLMVLANKDDTFPAVMANKVFAGQILTRAQLLVSFLLARETPKFKVISNG